MLLSLAFLPACVAPGGSDPITSASSARSADQSHDAVVPRADRTIQTWFADGRTGIANHHDCSTGDIGELFIHFFAVDRTGCVLQGGA
jgi:hypothetical protein